MTTQQESPIAPSPAGPVSRAVSAGLGGVLGDRTTKNTLALLEKIDPSHFESAYDQEHDIFHAEPEFAGHYIDAALATYAADGDMRWLERAQHVGGIMMRYQRPDGYIGTSTEGKEFESLFSVWNQQFSIMGLRLLFEQTGDRDALAAAMRSADYVIHHFRSDESAHFLEAINQGIENSCILIEIVHLYRLSGEARYLAFAEWIVDQWEHGSARLVSGTDIPPNVPSGRDGFILYNRVMRIGSLKAAETLLCYRGLLQLGIVARNPRYIEAVKRYWEAIRGTMIAPTGNGSIFEFWNRAAALPQEFTREAQPFENCVAVFWMELSLDLFELTGETGYFDDFERSLLNHLLGSQAIDGHDFSYYQPNAGAKVHETTKGLYSCCRYRGMVMLTKLARSLAFVRDDEVLLLLPSTSRVEHEIDGVSFTIDTVTDYPRSGHVEMEVSAARPLTATLSLRVPPGAVIASVLAGGEAVPYDQADGYVSLSWRWEGSASITIDFELSSRAAAARIGDRPVALRTYGPLVLAIDSREGTPIDGTTIPFSEDLALEPDHPKDWSRIVRFRTPGALDGVTSEVALVDYASAGSVDPVQDRFRIWVTTP